MVAFIADFRALIFDGYELKWVLSMRISNSTLLGRYFCSRSYLLNYHYVFSSSTVPEFYLAIGVWGVYVNALRDLQIVISCALYALQSALSVLLSLLTDPLTLP